VEGCALSERLGVQERDTLESMVDPDLQPAVDVMRVGELLDLIDYIEGPAEKFEAAVTEEQTVLIQSHAGDVQADPSIARSWGELDARTGRRK
jgi:hypothetical protein